ncbi:MAG: hypothetical protein AB7F89_00065 [Pirellulaceae bacterium]
MNPRGRQAAVRGDADSAAARGARWVRAADRLGRILLCVTVVAACVFVAKMVQEIRSADTRRAGASASAEASPLDNLHDLLNGNWQFAGLPWSVRVQVLSHAELERTWQVPAPGGRPGPATYASAGLDAATTAPGGGATELVALLLELLGASARPDGESVVYEVVQETLRVLAIAPREAPRAVGYARVGQRISDDRWNYLELTLTDARATFSGAPAGGGQQVPESPSSAGHLLPLAAGAEPLATRRNAAGSLLAELWLCREDPRTLTSRWLAAGWTVAESPAPAQSPATASHAALNPAGSGALGMWICTRGSETILALASGDSEPARTLLLVRSP